MTPPKVSGNYNCRWTLKEPTLALYKEGYIEIDTFTGTLFYDTIGDLWFTKESVFIMRSNQKDLKELIWYSKAD
jgi:hypothetical protein